MTAATAADMRERLEGESAAWLHMDDATNPMVVSGLLELAAVLPDEGVKELVRRLTVFLPFSARIVEPRFHIGTPAWESVEEEASAHVERVSLITSTDEALRTFVARTLSTRLDPSRPLWRVYVIDRPGCGTTLLFRVHHAIADGYALLGLLHALSDAALVLPPARPASLPDVSRWQYARRLMKAAERLLRLPPDRRTMLQAPLSGKKEVAWSAPVPLAAVKAIGAASFATVNDVLTSAVAGALRRYLARRGEPCDALELHAMVPVNLRTTNDVALTNRFGLVILGLPVAIADPKARIGAVHRRMKLLKESAEAKTAQLLLSFLGYLPPRLEDAVTTYFGRKASLVFTNLMGPRERAKLSGIPIVRMMFWVPEAAHLGLGISVFSYAGEISLCVLSDASVLPDPETLVADFQAELGCAA